MILLHPRFEFRREILLVDERVHVRFRVGGHGFLADVLETLAQQKKRKAADRLLQTVGGSRLRDKLDGSALRRYAWRERCGQSHEQYDSAYRDLHAAHRSRWIRASMRVGPDG